MARGAQKDIAEEDLACAFICPGYKFFLPGK